MYLLHSMVSRVSSLVLLCTYDIFIFFLPVIHALLVTGPLILAPSCLHVKPYVDPPYNKTLWFVVLWKSLVTRTACMNRIDSGNNSPLMSLYIPKYWVTRWHPACNIFVKRGILKYEEFVVKKSFTLQTCFVLSHYREAKCTFLCV